MISRRTVLVAGSGGLAAVGLGAIAQRAAAVSQTVAPAGPALFLIDTTLPLAAAAAEAARRAGILLVPFAGDIGTVWLDRLAPLWRHAPVAIAGASYGGALFCAERLAQDRGLMRSFALSPTPTAPAVANAARSAIAAAARPSEYARDAVPMRHDRPAVWTLVPRRSPAVPS